MGDTAAGLLTIGVLLALLAATSSSPCSPQCGDLMSTLTRQLSAALRMLLVLTVLCGVAYPLVVLGVGQAVAHEAANGSPAHRGGTVVASTSLGQQVTDPQWFQGRRSASEYAGTTSGGSNLGPNDPRQGTPSAKPGTRSPPPTPRP